jgi:hypothetical protein
MRYIDFESIMSIPRMLRYKTACGNDSKKAMTLYRLNLRLSQELFTIISCFEISLRNAIDKHYTINYGSDWLRDASQPGGIFDIPHCRVTRGIITDLITNFGTHYSHSKLLAKMDFGFWRYLFAQPQYRAGGQSLIHIFPAKPTSTPAIQYNQSFIFNELAKVNNIRNRIAHHEPICFQSPNPIISTTFARQHYALLLQLFQWMSIDEAALLYGLDHINAVCGQIDQL